MQDGQCRPARLEPAPWVRLGLGRSTVYRFISERGFPEPIKLGRLSRWDVAEVDAWIEGFRKKPEQSKIERADVGRGGSNVVSLQTRGACPDSAAPTREAT